jgi:DNA-directed RNA polymerase specialized sigma24 family protein
MNISEHQLEHIAVTLRLFYGLTDAEIVGLLGCSEPTYTSALKGGLRKMGEKMVGEVATSCRKPTDAR